ncbi:MAG TPA: alcohol dehydrogenase catalytic domain-containing protein [Acidimicrobiia bacterium]|nr:alcohol dehydrogenase catalytic domain-containing protein [Acidimicrobiia bacterium]
MRAAVLGEFGGDVAVRDVPDPAPGIGQVLVEVVACGVGLTLERARTGALGGTTPRVVGHELGGIVAGVGPGVTGWKPGERVTASFYLTCGSCEMCVGGRETLCTAWRGYLGLHIDGALASAVVLPAANLVRVPDGVGLDEAAIAADAIATPYHVFAERAPLRPGQTVGVIGAGGGVGVHMAGMARAFGARVVAIERDAAKEKRLGECEFDAVWSPCDEPEWSDALVGAIGGKVDICVDTVGSPSTLANGARIVGRGGTFVVVGFQPGASLTVDPTGLVIDEVAITGSRYATRAEIARTLDLVAQRRVEAVIGARFPLDDAAGAYRAMQGNEVFGRIVVDTVPPSQ